MNSVQYVSMVTDNGEKARRLKCSVDKNHFLYLKENCTWDELKTLISRGCTVGRVGTRSEFIAIDIDDSEITHEAMRLWAAGYNSAHGDCVLATPSRSGLWYKHHVYFKVPEYQMEDHFKVFTQCFHEITKHFGGMRVRFDSNAAKYYQCMFQTGEPGQLVLDGSVQLARWCKKDDAGPVPYVDTTRCVGTEDEWHFDDGDEAPSEEGPCDGRAILPNDRDFYLRQALIFGIPPRELSELPFELLRASHVRRGSRHQAIMRLADTAVRNAALLGFLGLAYTDGDVQRTLEQHIAQHFEDGAKYLIEDASSIKNAITSQHKKYAEKFAKTDRSYVALKGVLGKGSHRYGIKTFASGYIKDLGIGENLEDTCIAIVDAYNGCPDEYAAADHHKELAEVRRAIKPLFEKKKTIHIEKDLDEARRVYELTKDIQLFDDMPPLPPMSFEEFCKRSTAGDKLVVSHYNEPIGRKEHKPHNNKGYCGGYEVVDGVLAVPKDKVTPYIRSYCSRNGIKLVLVANE